MKIKTTTDFEFFMIKCVLISITFLGSIALIFAFIYRILKDIG